MNRGSAASVAGECGPARREIVRNGLLMQYVQYYYYIWLSFRYFPLSELSVNSLVLTL